jgi:L-seryl-tRNA(Ser) seleniumtransferase
METDHLRRLPAVGRLLDHPALRDSIRLYGRDAVKVQARREIEVLRRQIADPGAGAGTGEPSLEDRIAELPWRVARTLDQTLGARLRRVINATGVFLHTNLGRAPLPPGVAAEVTPLLTGYCDLEIDLAAGRRSDRNLRADRLVAALTGAEAAVVVNNNAAALVLALATLAAGREVVVSRGELVEIGGSFRIPEILAAAGARLVEVGTTNRTRVADYARAVGDDTALLLKVHPSNYRIEGFVESAEHGELAALGRERGIPVLVDEGSGLLRPSERPQLRDHPSFRELFAAGCDLACGSGDKLLGGPQAGILAGSRELVARCRRHPLYRAMRPNRFVFAALEAVLRRHLAAEPLPLDALWDGGDPLRARLEQAAAELGAEIVEADGYVGGGAAPEAPIPGRVLALPGDDRLLETLRTGAPGGHPPVVGYLRDRRLHLDLRTVDPADDHRLIAAVAAARREGG